MDGHCDTATATFARQYQLHLKHLRLKGLQPKTVEAYSRAIRRLGEYFGQRIDALSEAQLLEYFSDLVVSHSWSTVKLDLYGLKFYHEHVLKKPWVAPGLIKPPRVQRLPDIVTVAEADRLFVATRVLSYGPELGHPLIGLNLVTTACFIICWVSRALLQQGSSKGSKVIQTSPAEAVRWGSGDKAPQAACHNGRPDPRSHARTTPQPSMR